MSASYKPVTILTGFLGAGKTTYLNHLLQKKPNTRYAIIENEFGEQGIDGDLVVHPEETIVELNNGCLCCTLNDNLYDILNDLFDRRDEFDEIIIEATGVADPTGLAEPFLTQHLIREYFPLHGVICLVDAELITHHLRETEEAKNQVAHSDVLLINKTDLVSTSYVKELSQRLQRMNPLATVVVGNRQAFPNIDLHLGKSPLDDIFQRETDVNYSHEDLQFPVHKPDTHHHHSHTEEIVSHTFTFDQSFDYQLLDQQLFVYLMLQSKDLYRMKGLVCLEGSDDQHMVQSVGKRLDIEKRSAWRPGEQRKSVMVFIGKHLTRQGIERLLERCLSKQGMIES